MRILCVDDDNFVRQVLYKKGLEMSLNDDDIVLAASGEEAIDKISRVDFDLVISDLMMPGLSGLDVLRYVREHKPFSEVIIVTGEASIRTAVEAVKLGARDYIEKPISLELLVEKIANIRDYQNSLHEAEDLRLAKEVCEEKAGIELHMLECANQKMKQSIAAANKILGMSRGDTAEMDIENVRELLGVFIENSEGN